MSLGFSTKEITADDFSSMLSDGTQPRKLITLGSMDLHIVASGTSVERMFIANNGQYLEVTVY